jgi:hypothetical protein
MPQDVSFLSSSNDDCKKEECQAMSRTMSIWMLLLMIAPMVALALAWRPFDVERIGPAIRIYGDFDDGGNRKVFVRDRNQSFAGFRSRVYQTYAGSEWEVYVPSWAFIVIGLLAGYLVYRTILPTILRRRNEQRRGFDQWVPPT